MLNEPKKLEIIFKKFLPPSLSFVETTNQTTNSRNFFTSASFRLQFVAVFARQEESVLKWQKTCI